MGDYDIYESEIEQLYQPKEKKIELTLKEAKQIRAAILRLPITEENNKLVAPLLFLLWNKIEQAEDK